jgi:hypothetical protein
MSHLVATSTSAGSSSSPTLFGDRWVAKSLQDAVGDILNSPSASALSTTAKNDVEVAVEMAIDIARTKEMYDP